MRGLTRAGTRDSSEASDSPVTDSPSEQSTSPAPSARPGTPIIVRPSDYGPMLFDARDQAIYLFDREATPKPRCYDACAEAWPPVLTEGDPVASGHARPGCSGPRGAPTAPDR